MKKSMHNFFRAGFVIALPVVSALAQENAATLNYNSLPPPSPRESGWETGVNAAYVGGSSAKFNGQRRGDSDAFNFNVEAGTRIPLGEEWSLNVKLASDNFFFDQVAGDPIPSSVHTLRLNMRVNRQLNEQWTVSGLLMPSLYRFENVGQNDLGIAGGIMAMYRVTPSLTLKMGVLADPDSDIKLLPLLGVHWVINEHYSLDVGIPRTRLTYKVSSDWQIYAGADLSGTTFRSSDRLVSTPASSRYNDALANYRDVRLGVGTGTEITSGIRMEVEAGYSVYREIKYTHLDTTVKFNPAPYVRLGLTVKF